MSTLGGLTLAVISFKLSEIRPAKQTEAVSKNGRHTSLFIITQIMAPMQMAVINTKGLVTTVMNSIMLVTKGLRLFSIKLSTG
jgi:hypothetical protein